MSAKLLNGTDIANRLKQELKPQVEAFGPLHHPTLGVLYFTTPVSSRYWMVQNRIASQLGIATKGIGLPEFASQNEVDGVIKEWNHDPTVHGIFVHQPLPPTIDAQHVSALIEPRKDIEGIHPQNSVRRFFARARIGSCTALAVMRLLEETGEPIEGKEAVVVGHSEIVGRPVSMLLLDKLATTTICHVGTRHLEEHVRRAEILVVAVGKPRLIKGAWIKSGAAVIDVGINVVDREVVGDVEFETAKERAAYITPVPGGVGPVTVMMVMKNTIEAYKLQQGGA